MKAGEGCGDRRQNREGLAWRQVRGWGGMEGGGKGLPDKDPGFLGA